MSACGYAPGSWREVETRSLAGVGMKPARFSPRGVLVQQEAFRCSESRIQCKGVGGGLYRTEFRIAPAWEPALSSLGREWGVPATLPRLPRRHISHLLVEEGKQPG